MESKYLKNFFAVIFIALIIEIFVINFSNILAFLNTDLVKNKEYVVRDLKTFNWEYSGEKLVSDLDPMLIIDNIDTYIKEINISLESNKQISYTNIFYTNSDVKNFNGDAVINYNQPLENDTNIEIYKNVKSLRIDLGDEANLEINNLIIKINPVKINFNISRVIAMILIYYSAIVLSYIQKNPKYEVK